MFNNLRGSSDQQKDVDTALPCCADNNLRCKWLAGERPQAEANRRMPHYASADR